MKYEELSTEQHDYVWQNTDFIFEAMHCNNSAFIEHVNKYRNQLVHDIITFEEYKNKMISLEKKFWQMYE